MRALRRQRLIMVVTLVAGVACATGLALVALNRNINLFFSPSQVAGGEAPLDHTFRLGGLVEEHSVARDPGGLTVRFVLTDTVERIPVTYSGILPDLFREGQGIVAQGRLDGQKIFVADEVLAKHDESYMPPEVDHAIKTAVSAKLREGQM
ncbi:MAG: cytochrome c maturation protein CcmE [Gammaproteobacteria bacterium]